MWSRFNYPLVCLVSVIDGCLCKSGRKRRFAGNVREAVVAAGAAGGGGGSCGAAASVAVFIVAVRVGLGTWTRQLKMLCFGERVGERGLSHRSPRSVDTFSTIVTTVSSI